MGVAWYVVVVLLLLPSTLLVFNVAHVAFMDMSEQMLYEFYGRWAALMLLILLESLRLFKSRWSPWSARLCAKWPWW